jgi:hypothetical protein
MSCKKEMEQTIIEKSLTKFDTLTLNSPFIIYLTQGNEYSIKMTGAKVILDNISLDLNNYNLTIVNNYKENWLHPNNNKVYIYITTNKLNRIMANATCNIQTTNTLIEDEFGLATAGKLNEATIAVNCNYFYFWNNPPSGGKIVLSGTTKKIKLHNEALMAIDAQALQSNVAIVENWSKGDCQVTSLDTIAYSITGEGNIYVSGNPGTIIQNEKSSSGKLILE